MKKTIDICPECGGEHFEITDIPERYVVEYNCPDCGFEGHDFYEDLYGCMSVPWGFML